MSDLDPTITQKTRVSVGLLLALSPILLANLWTAVEVTGVKSATEENGRRLERLEAKLDTDALILHEHAAAIAALRARVDTLEKN